MRKIFITILLLILCMAGLPLAACSSGKTIQTDITGSLTALADKGTANIDTEIARLDKLLIDVDDKLIKLEQLIVASMQWIEYQKKNKPAFGFWLVEVTSDGLAQLQNDRFQVAQLEVQFNVDKVSTTLKITDTASRQTYAVETLQKELFSSRESLADAINKEIAARDLIPSTLKDILVHSSTWDIKKFSGNTYAVSGTGLGLTDKPVSGTWTFYQDTGEIVPRDQGSININTILLGKGPR